MPQLTFEEVSKSFGNTRVIEGFSAEVPDKEFLVLLGPSGCGKSTMLRMIAGLTDITEGRIVFDGVAVNGLEPKERNVAFVFQSYALYPHMSVRGNIAFPLLMERFSWWKHIPLVNAIAKRRLLRGPAIAGRIEYVAEMMELSDYLDRRPKTLSGGQRQRVAVARALVRDPALYLLDEPLSNLDAKLRTQMRSEIIALYRRVEKSFVYVTHDQVEAMTMGTRIIVLNEGLVQQYGTPQEIYRNPANAFVAGFIGSPAMNLFPGVVEAGQFRVAEAEGAVLDVSGEVAEARDVLLGVRAEKVSIETEPAPTGESRGPVARVLARVAVVEHLGADSVVGFKLGPVVDSTEVAAASRDLFFARVPGDATVVAGDQCWVRLDLADARWFEAGSGRSLRSQAVGSARVR